MSAIAIYSSRTSRISVLAGLALTVLLSLSGAKAAEPAATTNNNTPQTNGGKKPAKRHWYQIGRASWYGTYFQGRETASGETYNMYSMTCAHRTLPLGTLLRVTNLRNHKTVVVRVNDRGPVPESRVVDLSYAAANFLGFSQRGLAPVRLEVIQPNEISQLNWPIESLQLQKYAQR
jgi:rare lipoprotein A